LAHRLVDRVPKIFAQRDGVDIHEHSVHTELCLEPIVDATGDVLRIFAAVRQEDTGHV
jgi:hypothetical protein